VRGAAIGVVVAARRSGGHLGGATLWWLELLAGLAAAAAAQDGAVRVLERRAREAEVLLALTDVSNEDPTRFAARLADAIGRCLGLDFADLLIYDEERGELSVLAGGADARIVRSGGVGVDRVPAGSDHPAARAFASGQPYLRADVRDDPAARAAYAGRPVRAVAAVPVRVGSEPRGVLHLAARAPGAIGRPDLAFLHLVAARAGLLLEREDVHRRRADARAREEFVGVVSHELKTPVAVTSAYVELLQRRAEREGRRGDLDVLARIADENQRMLAMVEELLDVQRIDAGVLHLELSRFDLAALVERVAEGLQLTTAAHRIVVASRGPVAVLADRRRIEEILTNLLENAIKYSPGGGEVRVTACRDSTGPLSLARVEVADQGVGIAPEDQARIFDRFQRGGAGGRLHRGHHGLGLGLYIARELVRRHGGEMGVRSAPGTGSTFWFTLPTDGPAADD
jgi:signal transduction histidine kinase